jgi:uncharacterized repeat protein (TIGR01451 family)
VIFGRPLSSPFPAVFDLSSLDGNNGFVIEGGLDGDDSAGVSVSELGDFNGDGLSDFAVGAFRGDGAGGSNTGEAYILYGRNSAFPSTFQLSSLTNTTGLIVEGVAAQDRAGADVTAVADMNGDGLDEFLVSASQADPNGDNSGAVYLVRGASADLSLSKTGPSEPINVGPASLVYTIQVSNGVNSSPTSGVQVTDSLPANTTFNSFSGTDWSCQASSGVVTCDLAGTLAGNTAAPTLTITLDTTSASSFVNTATVTSPIFDPDGNNNSDTENTDVEPGIFSDGFEG